MITCSCADPGIFVRGVQVRLTKKAKKKFFFFFLVLSLFYRSQMVNFKEIYHFSRFQRGSNFFQGGGSNCLFPIETHITCDFPGGGGSGPPVPPLWIRTCCCHHYKEWGENVYDLKTFCGFSMGSNQYWARRVYDLCVYFMTGTPEGSTERGFMEKPGIEPATPGLQDIGLSPTPRRLLFTKS